MIRLLLLDFDGTLVDTRRANSLAYVEALAAEDYILDPAEYERRYFGMRCPEFLRALGFTDPETIDRIRRRKIECYPSYFGTVRLNRPLWDFSQQFRRQGGRVWIVSTGQPRNIENVMEYLGLRADIDGLVTGHDVPHGKPAPDAFLKAMEAEACSPDETLIFEDSIAGIEAARRTGASYIVVRL